MKTTTTVFLFVCSILIIAPACMSMESNLGSRLMSSVVSGNEETVKELLDQKADVNYKNYFHETPLEVAARRGRTNIVKLLLLRGAHINHQDESLGNTALHWAANQDYDDIVLLLLFHNARVDLKNKEGDTALHYVFDGFKGKSKNPGGIYPKLEKTKKIIRLLVAHGADVNAENKSGNTPYSLARRYNIDVLDLLQELGAQPEEQPSQEVEFACLPHFQQALWSQNSLDQDCFSGSGLLPFFQREVKTVPSFKKPLTIEEKLQQALEKRDLKLVESYVQQGANIDREDGTPILHEAVCAALDKKELKFVLTILSKIKNINIQDFFLNTALHSVIWKISCDNVMAKKVDIGVIDIVIKIIKLLIIYGVDVNIKNRIRSNAYDYAKKTLKIDERILSVLKDVTEDKEYREALITCQICLEQCAKSDTLLPCMHIFHQKCIDQWLVQNNSCPNCRSAVLSG